jgi:hypothetical protein
VTPRSGPPVRDLENVPIGHRNNPIGSLPVEARLYAAVILQARHDSLRRGQLGEQARSWLKGADHGGLTFQECVDAIEAFKPKERFGAIQRPSIHSVPVAA